MKNSRALVVVIMMALCFVISTCIVSAKNVQFLVGSWYNCKVSNEEGQYLLFESMPDDGVVKGNLPIIKFTYDYDFGKDESYGIDEYVLKNSNYYTIEPLDGSVIDDLDFQYSYTSKYPKCFEVYAKCVKRAIVTKEGVQLSGEKASTMEYVIGGYMPKQKSRYIMQGTMIGSVGFKDTQGGVVVDGAKGKVRIIITDLKKKTLADDSIYLFGEKTLLHLKDKKVKSSSGAVVPNKSSKNITGLYLRPANKGKNMFLTWNKVKGAKSYIVYKYSPVKNEYVKAAVRNSHNANYYNIPNAKNDIGYKYKIVAKAKEEGKGKKVCKDSYAVWAVAAGNEKGNVTSITTNKKKIAGKVGKSIKLKATVATSSKTTEGAAKKVLSKTIRWYSSNKKIATVNKKTGKVRFKKKGKCYIWAKAHNGKNSKRIKIAVK